jgi:dTDP-4-amino-4,6-dideoxygalactose transaminase
MTDVPAFLGGRPLSDRPLEIVRPRFPPLAAFAARFDAALRSGIVTNHGPHVQDFERRLAAYMDVPHVVVCNNGQTAIMLMLRAAGITSGEVVVPSYTFSATPHAVRWCGAEPIFADVAQDGSMCIDPSDVERRITPRTTAIVGVDVYGIACDYEALDAIGRRHGLPVLYDSAPSFGTRVGGSPVGGHGTAQAFSFHATKAFTTMEGGCVATHDETVARRVASLRNFGQTRAADCDEAGMNGKMTEICALIGLEHLRDFDAVAKHRAQSAERIREGLAGIPGLSFARPADGQTPVWLYFPVVVNPEVYGVGRERVAGALAAENLHVRKYFELPCHHLAAYSAQRDVRLPRAEALAYNVVALPVYNDMTPQECDLFVEAFRRIHRHAGAVRDAADAVRS